MADDVDEDEDSQIISSRGFSIIPYESRVAFALGSWSASQINYFDQTQRNKNCRRRMARGLSLEREINALI